MRHLYLGFDFTVAPTELTAVEYSRQLTAEARSDLEVCKKRYADAKSFETKQSAWMSSLVASLSDQKLPLPVSA